MMREKWGERERKLARSEEMLPFKRVEFGGM